MYAASDASGKLGYGVVEWTDESICHEVEKRMWKTLPPLQPMHIFLKEFYAVVRAVETLTAKHRGKLIVLAVDNTAVIGALRAMYSSNKHACDYIKRIDEQFNNPWAVERMKGFVDEFPRISPFLLCRKKTC